MSISSVSSEDANLQYTARIADLVATHITSGYRGLSHVPLLTALGCCTPVRNLGCWTISTSIAPKPGNENLVRNVLRQVLGLAAANLWSYTDNFALLNGLIRNLRWRDCLANSDDAHSLAALCLWHATDRSDTSPGARALRVTVTKWLAELLNEWIRPAVPYKECPDAFEIAQALFGEAWYHLCVAPMGVRSIDIAAHVFDTRPPFIPGLVTFDVDAADVSLPSLEGP